MAVSFDDHPHTDVALINDFGKVVRGTGVGGLTVRQARPGSRGPPSYFQIGAYAAKIEIVAARKTTRCRKAAYEHMAQPHASPRHAFWPSRTQIAEINSAIVGSSHHSPKNVFAASPTNTATARMAHRTFCVPSP